MIEQAMRTNGHSAVAPIHAIEVMPALFPPNHQAGLSFSEGLDMPAPYILPAMLACSGLAIWSTAVVAAAPVAMTRIDASAQQIDFWLASFGIKAPRLKSGQQVLSIANLTSHNLVAPEFFWEPVTAGDRRLIAEVDRGSARGSDGMVVAITRRPERYSMTCRRPFHEMLCLNATIVVDS